MVCHTYLGYDVVRITETMRQVAECLRYLHAQGLCHGAITITITITIRTKLCTATTLSD